MDREEEGIALERGRLVNIAVAVVAVDVLSIGDMGGLDGDGELDGALR